MEHDEPSDASGPRIASPSADAPIAAHAPTPTGAPPADDAPIVAALAPDAGQATPAPEASEPVPWKALAVGGAVAGLVVVLAGELEQREALAAELDWHIGEYGAALSAPFPPPRSPPPSEAPSEARWWNPVTSRPKHINFDWCFRFLWQTTRENRVRLVPSRASRSQYIRIGKLIPVKALLELLNDRTDTSEATRMGYGWGDEHHPEYGVAVAAAEALDRLDPWPAELVSTIDEALKPDASKPLMRGTARTLQKMQATHKKS